MRHSRIKQLALYVYQGSTERYKNFKNQRCSCGTKNLTIDENVKFQPYCKTIDPTFKWDRRMGRVQWSFETGNTQTTMFALLKYPTVPRWFRVKLDRKGE